jgi:aminoglycoside phosphotransferase (APT) family kinase protein
VGYTCSVTSPVTAIPAGPAPADDPEAVAALATRVLGRRALGAERCARSNFNAVYFVRLADGDEVAVRVTRAEWREGVALEAWALRCARQAGVAVPEVLAVGLDPPDFPRPYLITRRVAGLPGDSAELTQGELLTFHHDLGRQAARLHAVRLAGFGDLTPRGGTPAALLSVTSGGPGALVGPQASLWERLTIDLDDLEGKLPDDGRARPWLERVRRRFEAHRPLFAAERAALVHGDLQGKNLLVRGGRVAAVLDFECAEAGDPVQDFCPMDYWNRQDPARRRAQLEGYLEVAGATAAGPVGPLAGFEAKLALYGLLYGLHRLRESRTWNSQSWAERAYADLDRIAGHLDALA